MGGIVADHLGGTEEESDEHQGQDGQWTGSVGHRQGGLRNNHQDGKCHQHHPHQISAHHQQPPVRTVRPNPGRQGEHQPRQALRSRDPGNQNRITCQHRCQPGQCDQSDPVGQIDAELAESRRR